MQSISDDGIFLKVGILPENFEDGKNLVQSVIEKWKAKPESCEELRKALDKVIFEERGKGRLLSFYPGWMKNSEPFRIPRDGDNADGDGKLEGNSTYPVEDVSASETTPMSKTRPIDDGDSRTDESFE